MGAQVLRFAEQLESLGPCAECGIEFAAPSSYVKNRREDHKSFFCPNGHSLSYKGKSEVDRLRELLASKERDIEWQRSCRERAEKYASAMKGQVTKIKNRVGNGVCPCCNRSFTNLQRHMHTKHPDFKSETE